METNKRLFKILTSIFTYDKNIWLLKDLLESYERAKKDIDMVLVIIDFSEEPGKVEEFVGDRGLVIHNPTGFCQNFNFCREMVLAGGYDLYFCLNDDIRLHEDFFVNAIKRFIEMSSHVGFIGGTSQKGGWLEDPEDCNIPEPVDKYIYLNDIRRLHWEFSACLISNKALKLTGEMDYMFSPKLGLCADNDYLHRMSCEGIDAIRDHNVTFWHRKASTQSEFRCPWGRDPHRIRAVRYMKIKWGVDIDSDSIHPGHSYPFNNKEVIKESHNVIYIDGIKYDLEVV